MQWLQFERLRWAKGKPETAAYHCEGCERPIAEHHKTEMLATGEWRATAVSKDPKAIGFHLSALYSPLGWKSWSDVAREWLAAQGSDETLRAARNTLLGETWVESGDAPEWQRLADRRETWKPGTVPMAGLFLTAGADVQKDRIEVDIWAWGRGLESWLVDHIVIPGGPDDPAAWDKLTSLLGRSWQHANGAFMTVARLGIDTGYEAAAVYAWSRKVGFEQVAPLKGLEGFNRSAPVSGPTYVDATIGGKRLRRGARLWSVATATFKAETYRFLRIERPSDEDRATGVLDVPGTIHLPGWADTEWLKQLVAEQLVTIRNKRGYAHQEWQKMRERNEALDCRVYARAAAWILGADRWDEATWRRLEAQAGVETRLPVAIATDTAPPDPAQPKAGTLTTPRQKRRAYTPNFMRD
jgi:phage terminase large subunit GpA-like protein